MMIRDFERSMYQGTKIEAAGFLKKAYLELRVFDEDMVMRKAHCHRS
jgi:hypothetical protein